MFNKLADKLDRLAGVQPANSNTPTQQPYYPATQQNLQHQPHNIPAPPYGYGYSQQAQYNHAQQHLNGPLQQPQLQPYRPQGPIPIPHPQLQPHQHPLPRFHITKTSVHNLSTTQPFLTLTHTSNHLTLTHPSDGSTLGTLHFHSLSSNSIDYALNGSSPGSSSLKDPSQGLGFGGWKFRPILLGGGRGEKRSWKMKETRADGVLKDSSSNVVAKLEEGVLTFERMGLGEGECDEIVVTAVAIVERSWRDEKELSQVVKMTDALGGLGG
ncbi:hypothetical protein CLAFUW4_02560 [Fulvia fulva]|uniref:Uncharacterized protein n=1 Tax=Passalora fulva TaxID=5499 RepID=A0A9Q8LAW3_PASFU|nr:uncharacterized protein CLAFUR5_02549 [Fulvia fulva]KAK4632340.1 hypothetical protein CLAFUR4_02555 [Fulvia fulva]KAK4633584.1 hypothetical protein CLAFUR0_02559 [Fulvia fulva]UJO14121.1 hypothetical protein CLAFUR5_02549 [Fulvia fulva]WPV10501.1 hypothetical protein CLAFUW4_02560 [Fulvia fulva]WPV26821.1 hypothetical protein CLAFUW7_02560 [Fulvia fulva]